MSTNILHPCLSWKQTLTTINFRVSFQGCLHSKWSQKIKIFLLSEQRVGLLTALDNKGNVSLGSKNEACVLLNVKDSGSRSSGFFSCNTSHCMCRHPSGPVCITPMGLGSKDDGHKFADAHAYCCAGGDKGLRPWPESLLSSASICETGRPNPLACKQGNFSSPSYFLTVIAHKD